MYTQGKPKVLKTKEVSSKYSKNDNLISNYCSGFIIIFLYL